MSNNAPARVRNSTEDPRVTRTTHALGRALIELIQERDYDDITVQQILDRAGVGRATFYSHYRNKDDALHTSYEGLFALMEGLLVRRSSTVGRYRLFPVREFVEHIAEAQDFADALRRSGLLDDAWGLFAGYAARIIERRLASLPEIRTTLPRQLGARMLAGALFEMIRWWWEDPERATAGEMEVAFHELARGLLGRCADESSLRARRGRF